MLRCILLAVFAISLSGVATAQCPAGVRCNRPILSAVAPRPTLAPRAHVQPARSLGAKSVERSVVVRRSYVRQSPGWLARIRFAPQSRWR